MLKAIITAYYENNAEHISCGQQTTLLNVEAGGTYAYHCALEV
jgi:lipoate-protein ligase B